MKKRTLCLLLAGVMALSLLSGCGGKPTGGQPDTPDNSNVGGGGSIPDNVPNNEAPMVPPDDWEESAQPEDDLPFPRDPRWDELQPGETAAQYYDIFIKSGMTLDEVVEAVEGSEAYKDQFITWEKNAYGDVDKELTVGSWNGIFGAVTIETSNGNETVSEMGTSRVDTDSMTLLCDGKSIMYIDLISTMPGGQYETYRVGDIPVLLVRPGKNDLVLSSAGKVADLYAVNKDSVEGLLDVFKTWDPDTEMVSERKSYDSKTNFTEYTFYSHIPFSYSWNGYSLWYCLKGGEPAKGVIPVQNIFRIDAATGELCGNPPFNIGIMADKGPYYLYWAADDAG